MPRVGISLGSNLGDRLASLTSAVHALKAAQSSDHFLVSGLFETAPVDCPANSPYFYNCVVEIEVSLNPEELLDLTQEIERSLGRPEERARNAARQIDLDLLYYDDLALNTPRLTLPHPRWSERAFVILPLLEIRPDFGEQVSLDEASLQGIDRISGSSWLN